MSYRSLPWTLWTTSAETVCPSFDDPGAITEWIGKSDLVLLEYDGSSKVFAFATCSCQTVNSRTVVYAAITNE